MVAEGLLLLGAEDRDDEPVFEGRSHTHQMGPPKGFWDNHQLAKGEVEIPQDDNYDFSFAKLWLFAGPGMIMAIAYIDPGNLESDLQSGAQSGYSLLWVLLWCTVLGGYFQILSARLGVVTGKNLAEIARERLPRPASLFLWLMAESAIIGSDIQEVVGSAIALNILFGIPLYAGVLITAADTFTFLFLHYYGVRKLEAVFGVCVMVMVGCFAVCFGISSPDNVAIARGTIIPTIGPYITLAVGTLGAVIMPHNLYLHSALVQSRSVDRNKEAAVSEANLYNAIESSGSLAVSFIINLFVVCVFAAGFFNKDGAGDIGLGNAADNLAVQFGDSAKYIFGIGLLAAGQTSTMTGTLAGQYVMEGFLELKVSPWFRLLITRSLAIVPAVIVALIANGQLDALDQNINILQSIQLPFAMLPLLLFVGDRSVMGPFAMSFNQGIITWIFFVFILAVNVYLVQDFTSTSFDLNGGSYVLLTILAELYFGFIIYLIYNYTMKMHSMTKPFGQELLLADSKETTDVIVLDESRDSTYAYLNKPLLN